MRDEHIKDVLDGVSFAALGERERERVRAHAAACEECRRAYLAARACSQLIGERAALEVEPSPFFQTRVMAALRERQAADVTSSFARLWKTAGALVSSMAAAVVLLAGLTFLAPATQTQDAEYVSNTYAVEEEVLARDDSTDEELSYEQVMATIYEAEEE